jgi:ribosomal protein L10
MAGLGRGDSSVVTVSMDSRSQLTAVKTVKTMKAAQDQDCKKLIRRDAAILRILKNPLIVRILKQNIFAWISPLLGTCWQFTISLR